MKRFLDFDWTKVAQAMPPAAKLIRLSPTMAQIYLYPYGHIEVSDNGGEVNVSWNYIQGLELPIPDNIKVENFSLAFSVPYDVPGNCANKIGLAIKNAIDSVIAETLAFKQYLYLPSSQVGEIRVIEFKPPSIGATDEKYLTQCKSIGSDRWKTHSLHEELRTAIEYALKLEEAQTSKNTSHCCLQAH
jgi:hypothetical protein